eukprot:COSAG02_NODE_61969_length_267_cov_0.619048_1_plen_27_part_01
MEPLTTEEYRRLWWILQEPEAEAKCGG